MERHIISAPRSGLNWVRFCVEYFYGARTPGKPLLIPRVKGETHAFKRYHDPLGAMNRRDKKHVWRLFDPAECKGDKVVLIVRDPLEAYKRMANRNARKFRLYVGNLRFYVRARTADRRVFYYEDLISDPNAMFLLLEFLDITPGGDRFAPSREEVAEAWEEAGKQSRALYNVNQKTSGGASTKEHPLDFRFHQRQLSKAERARVWDWLRRNLSDEEFALIERYVPKQNAPAVSSWARLRGMSWISGRL